jgi:hypothetical protein
MNSNPTDAFIDAIAERVAEKVLARLPKGTSGPASGIEYLLISEAAKIARKSRNTIYEAIYAVELLLLLSG